MQYRPHIDGLRAVAILPVLAFHLDLTILPGGFTGVDVFFVISGFLITTLIVQELKDGDFSIWQFYKRRALRILPAFLVVIFAVMAASWFLFLPDETRGLGRSAVAAALFVANFLFWQSSDYFAPDLEMAPLLHTWTLSVEEQFYVFLPLLLMLVAARLGRRFALTIAAIALVSFLLCVVATPRFESAAFYLLPTRAWEFGLGALAATVPLALGVLARTLASVLGALLVLWGFFMLGAESTFPGANALFPAAGATLLIVCAEGTFLGRALSWRPMVWVGRRSYSLYLWHWPIIVFWKTGAGTELGPSDATLIAGLSLVAATLSYRFVEQPFRTSAIRTRRPGPILGFAAASIAGIAALGLAMVPFADNWGRVPPDVEAIADYADYRDTLEIHPCVIHAGVPGGAAAFDPARCLPDGTGGPTLLLIGDSHAEHLAPAFEDAFSDWTVQIAGGTGCLPVVGWTDDWYCPAVIRRALDEHVPGAGIDILVLSARWTARDLGRLQDTARFLAPHVGRVVILGPTPEFQGSFPLLLARQMRAGRDSVERFLDPEIRALDQQMAAMDWQGASYVSLYDLLCPDRCRRLTRDGAPYFADYGHYTRAAALEVALDLAALPAFQPPP